MSKRAYVVLLSHVGKYDDNDREEEFLSWHRNKEDAEEVAAFFRQKLKEYEAAMQNWVEKKVAAFYEPKATRHRAHSAGRYAGYFAWLDENPVPRPHEFHELLVAKGTILVKLVKQFKIPGVEGEER